MNSIKRLRKTSAADVEVLNVSSRNSGGENWLAFKMNVDSQYQELYNNAVRYGVDEIANENPELFNKILKVQEQYLLSNINSNQDIQSVMLNYANESSEMDGYDFDEVNEFKRENNSAFMGFIESCKNSLIPTIFKNIQSNPETGFYLE